MKISEAFEMFGEIDINYVFECPCPKCRRTVQEIDEEYSFCGDKDYFTGDWAREYGVMDLDDEIEQIEGNSFNYHHSGLEEVCRDCENMEEEQ